MMFFNLGVGCFVFSHANLGLSCSPVGERTEAVEHTYVFFLNLLRLFLGVCPGAKTMISIMF